MGWDGMGAAVTREQTALRGEGQAVGTARPTAESSDSPRQSVIRECSSVNERWRPLYLDGGEEQSVDGGSRQLR